MCSIEWNYLNLNFVEPDQLAFMKKMNQNPDVLYCHKSIVINEMIKLYMMEKQLRILHINYLGSTRVVLPYAQVTSSL